jgi:hypothetical protein
LVHFIWRHRREDEYKTPFWLPGLVSDPSSSPQCQFNVCKIT